MGRMSVRSSANPVAAALEATITRFDLPRQPLLDLIEARTHDLYDDPVATLNDLEGYCGETVSALFRLSALVLADGEDPGAADAAGLCRRRLRDDRPDARLSVPCAAAGNSTCRRWRFSNGTRSAGATLWPGGPMRYASALRWRRCAPMRAGVWVKPKRRCGGIDPRIGVAFLPLAIVPLHLDAMEARDYAPYEGLVEVPRWRKLWRLWRRARRGLARLMTGLRLRPLPRAAGSASQASRAARARSVRACLRAMAFADPRRRLPFSPMGAFSSGGEQAEIDVHSAGRSAGPSSMLSIWPPVMWLASAPSAVSGRHRAQRLAQPFGGAEAPGQQADRGALDIALAAGDLTGEAQPRHGFEAAGSRRGGAAS